MQEQCNPDLTFNPRISSSSDKIAQMMRQKKGIEGKTPEEIMEKEVWISKQQHAEKRKKLIEEVNY